MMGPFSHLDSTVLFFFIFFQLVDGKNIYVITTHYLLVKIKNSTLDNILPNCEKKCSCAS